MCFQIKILMRLLSDALIKKTQAPDICAVPTKNWHSFFIPASPATYASCDAPAPANPRVSAKLHSSLTMLGPRKAAVRRPPHGYKACVTKRK